MAPIFRIITMVHRRLQQARTAIREHTAVGYAKIAAIGWYSDVELIIIKAAAPDDVPLPERYVHQLVKIISFSPSSSRAFSLGFTRRFGRTRCWRVALKCLALLHRLLRALPESNSFHSDLLWARENGLLSLHPCQFRDTSSSASPDFTVFIRSYASLLNEALDCFSITKEGASNENLQDRMKEIDQVLVLLTQLQNVIDRAVKCMPFGVARQSFLVRSTMKQIIRDSILCYETFQKDVSVLLDNLFQLPYRSSISAMKIYKKAAFQAAELSQFYDSCKSMGLCGSYEYPLIDKIPPLHIQALESFLNEMWQLTESSSHSSITPPTTSDSPPSTSTDNSSSMQLASLETIISTKWEKFEEEGALKEEAQLIHFEEQEPSWEVLLEQSARVQRPPRDLLTPGAYECSFRYSMQEQMRHGEAGWDIQVYDTNPFGLYAPNHHGVVAGENSSSMDPRWPSQLDYIGWYSFPPYALLGPSSPCLHPDV